MHSLTRAEVEAVFVEMDLPLVERGIDEVQTAKDRLMGVDRLDSTDDTMILRVVVSDGTGKTTSKRKNAKLEPSPL